MPPMAKANGARRIVNEELPLFLGEWLTVLGVKQSTLARETEINEGYISQLCRRGKGNPSFYILAKIADFLRIGIDQLRQPPPSRDTIEAIRSLDPKLINRIHRDPPKSR